MSVNMAGSSVTTSAGRAVRSVPPVTVELLSVWDGAQAPVRVTSTQISSPPQTLFSPLTLTLLVHLSRELPEVSAGKPGCDLRGSEREAAARSDPAAAVASQISRRSGRV